jgi:hypothetical protein
MKRNSFGSWTAKIGGGLLAALLAPGSAWACACGCGVFDVGTSQMFPTDKGGMVFLDYDYQDQNRNWNGTSPAPRANNNDKEIETHFVTVGAQYMFNRSWGAQIEVPYDFRHFKTQADAGNVISRNWSQLGDIRIRGIYTGFLADLSAGLTFGLKLPTGDFKFDPSVVDRDTQIGTGSTDLLLGGFFRHNLDRNQWWDGFAQFELDAPVLTQNQYRPGVELDTAAGVDYGRWSLGKVGISPVAQIIFSERTSDSGAASASPVASGYQRLMLSPGVEFHVHPVKIYADAEFPIFQHFTGNQVAASVLYKVSVSWMF